MDDVLSRALLFQGLTAEAAAELSGDLVRGRAAKGAVIFTEGEQGDCLYVILSGKLKIGRTTSDGRENMIAVLGPGDIVGELSLFDPGPRTATATALTDSELARLDQSTLRPWLSRHPEVAEQLLRTLARRLRRTNDQLADLVFTDVPGRVAKALLSLAERFGTPEGEGTRVRHDLTQEELAQLVGASRETVNKALADFAGRGWLQVDSRSVLLLDRERLTRRAR